MKSKSGCKTSILLFLLGVLLFFLALGSMKEGQTNPSICPKGSYISKNDSNKCCQGKQNWYISKNDNTKCCANKGISINNNKYCGTQKKTIAVDAVSTTTSTTTSTPPTNTATFDLFNQYDSDRDNLLSEEEIKNIINKKFPSDICDDNCFYSRVDSLIESNEDGKVKYESIKDKLTEYL